MRVKADRNVLPWRKNHAMARHLLLATTATILSLAHLSGAAYAASIQGLGDLPGGIFLSEAYDCSSGGAIVVGRATSNAGDQAFIWDAANGMRRLQDVLTSLGADTRGWTLSVATAISFDGTKVIGYGIHPLKRKPSSRT